MIFKKIERNAYKTFKSDFCKLLSKKNQTN